MAKNEKAKDSQKKINKRNSRSLKGRCFYVL